ncbi:MAG: flagellar biosynthesis protein FlgD, partial [Firmicutes bacterium]|nr:flagellar biosynthesis protein FlgD [Bacillota bacterium]
MGVDAVNSQNTIEQIINETTSGSEERNLGELDKDDFLNLLVTQLQYQDPLQPMKDTEFISQMAQFSSLEQMQNLNQSASTTQAVSLIGKNVVANIVDSQTGEIEVVGGEVTNVKIIGGQAYVVVNGEDVPVDNVLNVSAGESTSRAGNLASYTNLIGLIASVFVADESGDDTVRVNGIVVEVLKGEDEDYVVMDGVKVRISEIVTESPSADPDFMIDYLEDKVGEEITVKIADEDGENKVEITAFLREFEEDEDG